MLEIINDTQDFIRQKPTILVIGVGGGGGNAINQMIEKKIGDVTYIAVNTDAAALSVSQAEHTVQIGKQLLSGLGAGAKPELGKSAMEEDKKELDAYLENVEMVFLTCGLGGGTGTGAIPIIAEMCKERGILTVAVVTTPFFMEGFIRNSNSQQGLENLKSCVDTLLVIPNDKLLDPLYQDFTFEDCLKLADNVLVDSVSAICNIIFHDGMVNIDFGDVRTIMENTGLAYIGFGKTHSSNGLMDALEAAIHSPLLETDIRGARKLILNCSGKISMADMQKALENIHTCTNPEANIIMGTVGAPNAEDEICVTLIATDLADTTQPTPLSDHFEAKNSTTPVKPIVSQPPKQFSEPQPYKERTKFQKPYGSFKKTTKNLMQTQKQQEIKIPPFLKNYTNDMK